MHATAATRDRLLDILRTVQAEQGCISDEAVREIAHGLGLRKVEVHDAITFYSFLSRKPKGRAVIRLSKGIVEKQHGLAEVARAFEEAVGAPFGETAPDGSISLEYTNCIGMSDQPPSALVGGQVMGAIRPEEVPDVVARIRAEGRLTRSRVETNLLARGACIFAPMEHGRAIRAAVNQTPAQVIADLNRARLRGRGGAGFPTAMKWDFCRKAPGRAHYVVCNADEGEPGTFKDRVIFSEAPDLVVEGMTVAGYAVGASFGLLYLRAEYAWLLDRIEEVLARRRHQGLLGANICGKEGFDFDIRVQLGAGAYVCGEESSLLESAEGKRGAPRDRPPFPVSRGYLGQPTAVNNAETLCCAARILEKGAGWFSGIGTKDSTGTKLFSVSGDCRSPGVYELPMGTSVDQLLEMVGRRRRPGRAGGRALGLLRGAQGLRPQALLRGPGHRRLGDGVRRRARPAGDRAGLHRVLCRGVLRLVRPLPRRHDAAAAHDRPDRRGARGAGRPQADGGPGCHRQAVQPLRSRADSGEPFVTTLRNFPQLYEAAGAARGVRAGIPTSRRPWPRPSASRGAGPS